MELFIAFGSGCLFSLLVVALVGHVYSKMSRQATPLTFLPTTPDRYELPVDHRDDEAEIKIDKNERVIADAVSGLGRFG